MEFKVGDKVVLSDHEYSLAEFADWTLKEIYTIIARNERTLTVDRNIGDWNQLDWYPGRFKLAKKKENPTYQQLLDKM